MAREIGSEFWDVPIIARQNNIFQESTQWYLSGRSALQAIIADLGEVRSVSLPAWCCDSMVKPFIDAGIAVHFYSVYWQNGLIQEISLEDDALFLMDYFGYTGKQPDLSDYKGVVIRDVTHSLFSATYSDADYFFGSLRKWCGVWTGGYAWTRDGHRLKSGDCDHNQYIVLRENAMREKSEYISGNRKDKGYLKIFGAAEDCLETVCIAPAADRDVALAKHIDAEYIAECRRANAEVLRKAFPVWLIFPERVHSDVPMFVPVLVPDGKRDNLRRHLIKKDIYCPIHWSVSQYHRLNERTSSLYENELSLVCDQRYTEADMNRMVEIIEQFMEEQEWHSQYIQ